MEGRRSIKSDSNTEFFLLTPKMTVVQFLLCCVLFVHTLCVDAITEENDSEFVIKKTMPAYNVALSVKHHNSTRCRKELNDFRVAVDHRILWGLKMLDASGRPKPGFIYGNNYWFGSQTQCRDVSNRTPLSLALKVLLNNTRYRNPDDETSPFEVNYFVAHFRHNSTLQYHVGRPDEDVIALGLCMPASCTSTEIGLILKRMFNERSLLINDLYSVDFNLMGVNDSQKGYQWFMTGKMIFLGCVIIFILSLMFVGTIYDMLIHKKQRNKKKKLSSYSNNNGEMINDAHSRIPSTMQQSKIGSYLQCFSVFTNTRSVFNTKLTAGSVPEIHGLKFLSMVWIIAIHTIYFMFDYIDNKPRIWRISEQFLAQLLTNSVLSVDTFFCLSGFLLTYGYINSNKDKNEQGSFNWASQIKEFFLRLVKRYIRLTPAYMMTIGIAELSSGWSERISHFYNTEKHHELCAEYWWANALYINNLFSRDVMCLAWSWYLSNDMQFFIIGNIILMISSRHFVAGAASLCGLLLLSLVASGYISYVHEYQPTLDEMYRLAHELYDPPWVRIGPYLVGMATAYIVIKLDGKLRLKKRTITICGYVATVCNLLVLFGLWDRHISILSSAFYVALGRTAWAIGIAWLLIACRANHGGIVHQILSLKFWIPLSKLTYCAYLLNPIVISSSQLYGEASVHVDVLPTLTLFFGNVMTSYIFAYILHVMMETPFILLVQRILKYFSPKKIASDQIAQN